MGSGSSSKPHIGPLQERLGITLDSMRDGRCVVKATIEVFHLNKGGVAHGGLHATLLDTAMGGAVVSCLDEEEWCATVQLDLSYLNAAHLGSELTCQAEVMRRGRTIAHVKGEILDQNLDIVAMARGTWAIWPGRPDHLKMR